MRISLLKEDPGYATWIAQYARFHRRPVAHVFVDGIEIERVLTADEEDGFVLALATDTNGRILLNQARTGIEERELRGSVRIEFE